MYGKAVHFLQGQRKSAFVMWLNQDNALHSWWLCRHRKMKFSLTNQSSAESTAQDHCFVATDPQIFQSTVWPVCSWKSSPAVWESWKLCIFFSLYILSPWLQAQALEKNNLIHEKHDDGRPNNLFPIRPLNEVWRNWDLLHADWIMCLLWRISPFTPHSISPYWLQLKVFAQGMCSTMHCLTTIAQYQVDSSCAATGPYLRCLHRHSLLKCSWIQIYAGSQYHSQLGREGTRTADWKRPQTQRIF